MTLQEKALEMHREWNGKLETTAKAHVNSREDLSIAYTPGVAEPCKVIAKDKEAAYTYTMKANTVAVVSDGSAVLGLGNIGALAAMPVMEGKAVLFKEFGGVNAVPICLDTQDTEEIIQTVVNIAPAFGGINLEDISAPRCFEIETRLKELLDIPVFHDDQHGTAIVVLAGIINAMKVTGKKKEDCTGRCKRGRKRRCGHHKAAPHLRLPPCDHVRQRGHHRRSTPRTSTGCRKRWQKSPIWKSKTGTLADALKGADIFVGVSAPGIVTKEMVSSMNSDCHPLCHGQPGTGDHAGSGKGGRRKGCGNRALRLPQPGQQCGRFPRYIPRRPGGPGHPDHRRNEAGCRPRHRRPCARGRTQ